MTLPDTSTPVLILRSHSHGGLNIMKSLGPLGVKIYNLDPNRLAPANHSRYCHAKFEWDIDSAPGAASMAYLAEVQRRIGQKAILIPTTDFTTRFVDRWRTSLQGLNIFPEQPQGLMESLCSKKWMYFLARQHGIPTPECHFPASLEDLEALLPRIEFPVMLKGIDGQRLWERVGKKMFILKSADELVRTYAGVEEEQRANLMIQEYIPGGDDSVWMFNGYFNQRSDCLVGFTGKKIRQCPIRSGCTSLGVCLPNKEVEETTRHFMKALGYRGILDIGYRYDARDGLYKVLDVNPRIGATFRLFVGSDGMDVARALYLDLTGQPVPPSAAVNGRKWIVEDLDLLSSYRYHREGSLTIRDWFKSLRGINEGAFLSWRDPLPLFFVALTRLREIVARHDPKSSGRVLRRPRAGAVIHKGGETASRESNLCAHQGICTRQES